MKLLFVLLLLFLCCCQSAKKNTLASETDQDSRLILDEDIAEHQQVGDCRVSIFSNTRTGHLKIVGEPNNCDPADEKNFSNLLETAKKIAIRTGMKKEIYLTVPYPSPAIVKRWAPILAQSTQWKKRPKPKSAWDTSSYPIVSALLNENREAIYAPYSELLKSLGYIIDKVEIEKLGDFAPQALSCCKLVLENLGFSVKNKLPYPLMTLIKAKHKAN